MSFLISLLISLDLIPDENFEKPYHRDAFVELSAHHQSEYSLFLEYCSDKI